MSQSQDLSGDVYITLKKQQPLTLQELAALVQATPEAVRLALADLGADGIRVWADSQGKLSISTKTFPDFTAPAESLSADSTAAAAAPDSTAQAGAADTAAHATAEPPAANAAAGADAGTILAAGTDTAATSPAAAGADSTAAATSNAAADAPAAPFDGLSSQERGELPPDDTAAHATGTDITLAAASGTAATSAGTDNTAAATSNAAADAPAAPFHGLSSQERGELPPDDTAAQAADSDAPQAPADGLAVPADPSANADGNGGTPPPAGTPDSGAQANLPAAAGETSPDLEALRAQKAQEEDAEKPEEKPMTLMGHLNELRWRLFRCVIAAVLGFVACYSVADILFGALLRPLTAALPANSKLIYTALPEAFFTQMQVAFVAGLFLVSPYVFYQIWSFIAPGLYDEEKRFAIPVALTSAMFFIGGACFCYFIVFPFAFVFFMGFATDTIQPMPSLAEYLSFALKLLFAFGLIFEMPLFTFFLARMGVVTAAMMRSVRRYAILAIFIIAAILTPPDVMSQLLMACPMLLLYETSILIAKIFGRKPKPKTEPAPAEEQG